jgi:hypothetical protein
MKRIVFIVFCLIFLSLPALWSQNAPVTIAGRVTNAVAGNPSVPIAVTVTGFNNIGQFTLTMKFDTTRVHFVSVTKNPALTGMTVTYTHPSDNTQGKLVFAWNDSTHNNVSLADGSSIADLTFSYVSGTGILTWSYIFGSICQYKSYVAGVLTSLGDSPNYLFYQHGGISNRSAPVTFAPDITNPVPGTIQLPILVNGFTSIGAITLHMEYDPAIISYNNFTNNPALNGGFQVGDNPGIGGKRLLVIQWYGLPTVSLSNGSTLCTLFFNYLAANCNVCALSWYDDNSTCEYTDGTDVLIDMPQNDYYKNGLVEAGLQNTWTGNINSAWENAGNWNACGVPDITRNIIIPNVTPNSFPVVTTAAYCKTISISSGAALTIGPTGSVTIGE